MPWLRVPSWPVACQCFCIHWFVGPISRAYIEQEKSAVRFPLCDASMKRPLLKDTNALGTAQGSAHALHSCPAPSRNLERNSTGTSLRRHHQSSSHLVTIDLMRSLTHYQNDTKYTLHTSSCNVHLIAIDKKCTKRTKLKRQLYTKNMAATSTGCN